MDGVKIGQAERVAKATELLLDLVAPFEVVQIVSCIAFNQWSIVMERARFGSLTQYFHEARDADNIHKV
jgi:hypothetical protein